MTSDLVARLRAATFTKGRTRGGVGGQTIEAMMASTFHEVSALDLDMAADALEAQAARIDELEAAEAVMRERCAEKALNGCLFGCAETENAVVDRYAKHIADAIRAIPLRARQPANERDAFNAGVRAAAEQCDFADSLELTTQGVEPTRQRILALLRPEAAPAPECGHHGTNEWGDDIPGRIPDYD